MNNILYKIYNDLYIIIILNYLVELVRNISNNVFVLEVYYLHILRILNILERFKLY